MPETFVEAATWDTPIQGPNDGESALSDSVKATLTKRLTNRTKYLKDLAEVSGVARLRSVADVAALKAVTGQTTSDLRFVKGKGVYRFDSGAAGPEALPWIVQPTVGGGFWEHELVLVQGTDLATVVSGKVVEPVPYGTRGVAGAGYDGALGSTIFTTTSASYVDSGIEASFAGNVAIGDVLVMHATIRCAMSAAGASGYVQLAHEQNAVTTAILSTVTPVGREGAEDKPVTLHLCARFAVAASFSAGTPHKVKIQIKSNGTDTAKLFYNAHILMTQVRP